MITASNLTFTQCIEYCGLTLALAEQEQISNNTSIISGIYSFIGSVYTTAWLVQNIIKRVKQNPADNQERGVELRKRALIVVNGVFAVSFIFSSALSFYEFGEDMTISSRTTEWCRLLYN